MVATLLRLKLRILGHQLGREPWRAVMLGLGGLWALAMLPSLGAGLVWLSGQPTEVRHDILVIAGSLLFLGWALVPVLVFGSDNSLDPEKFATLGMPARRLAPGLFISGLISVPAAFTALTSLGVLIAWWDGGVAVRALVVVCAVLATATALLCARLATTGGSRLLGSRRAREATAVTGTLIVALLVPAVMAVGRLGLDGAVERVPVVADVLAWTPLGAVWSVPAFAADGAWTAAWLHLAVAVAAVVLGYRWWTAMVARAMVSAPVRGGDGRQHGDRMLTGVRARPRTPAVAAGLAIAARSSRYWVADPRYLVSLSSSLILPAVIAVLLAAIDGTPDSVALSLGLLIAGTVGWGRHNDVAYDASAFWMHVASGVDGVADRTGRALAVLAWGVPAVAASTVLGVSLVDRWELLPAALGAGLGVLAAGLAVSAVSSVTVPYRVAPAGSSPFATEVGTAGASIVAQLVTSVAITVLSAPVLVGFAFAASWRASLGWVVLPLGVLGGALVLWRAIVWGGALYDRRAALVLARLS